MTLALHHGNHDEVCVKTFWAVGIGAAAGGLARYYLASAFYARYGGTFPWATLLINISGSLLLGFIIQYAVATPGVSPEMRVLLTTGFCGGYTTFSTFSYETAALLEEGRYERAALYVGGSVLLALAGTFAGFAVARQLVSLRKGL
jgi:fluoride exporter